MAGGFYGAASVLASRNKHIATGKVTTAVLTCNSTGTVVTYANAYVWPVDEQTGLGTGGAAAQRATIVLWQIGESEKPRADDTITVGGLTWVVEHVETRLNADPGFAVHDCSVYRSPTSAG